MNLFTKQKQTHKLKRMNLWLPGGRVGGTDRLGVWDRHVYNAIFKIDNQRGPTV